jgi:hypothetical protein
MYQMNGLFVTGIKIRVTFEPVPCYRFLLRLIPCKLCLWVLLNHDCWSKNNPGNSKLMKRAWANPTKGKVNPFASSIRTD